MTGGVVGSFGDPDRSRGTAALSRTAHALPWIAAVLFGWSVAEDLIGADIGPRWLSLSTGAAGGAVVLVALVHMRAARLCLRCMREVPADAPVRARRRLPLLWMQHHPGRVVLVWVALVAAGTAVHLGLGMPATPSWTRLGSDLWSWGFVAASWTHHRLRPWCRWCRRWDGGQGPRELSPTPDPQGVKSA